LPLKVVLFTESSQTTKENMKKTIAVGLRVVTVQIRWQREYHLFLCSEQTHSGERLDTAKKTGFVSGYTLVEK
jgi:hypothetical protein